MGTQAPEVAYADGFSGFSPGLRASIKPDPFDPLDPL
jgi:hypothetical protein